MRTQQQSIRPSIIVILVILNILSAVRRLYYELSLTNHSAFFITFYFFELFYYVVAIVFGFIRKDKQYDLPVFYEMSSNTYWYFVLVVDVCLKVPFITRFIELSSLNLFLYLGMIFIVVQGFIRSYQMDIYNSKNYYDYRERLQELLTEAKITPEELSLVQEDLLKRVVTKQRTPLAWRMVLFAITIVSGSILGAIASALFDNLVGIGIGFPNIILPK